MAVSDLPKPLPATKADALERANHWLTLALKQEEQGKAGMTQKALDRAVDYEALAFTL